MIDVIPAIDVIEGCCVRLAKGDYATKTVYSDDPVEMAKRFEDAGITRLHLVDLDGAKVGAPQNLRVLENICNATALSVDFGGGLKSIEDLKAVRDAGAAQVSIGSVAVQYPERMQEWFEQLPLDFFILCADVKGEHVAVHGWQEIADQTIDEFISFYRGCGVSHFLCTNIERDGTLAGTDEDLYVRLLATFPGIYLIASGGISSYADIVSLADKRVPAVVVGKAYYEGHISLAQLGAFYAQ